MTKLIFTAHPTLVPQIYVFVEDIPRFVVQEIINRSLVIVGGAVV